MAMEDTPDRVEWANAENAILPAPTQRQGQAAPKPAFDLDQYAAGWIAG
jgi:hypothetical protein